MSERQIPITCLTRQHALPDGELRLLGAHASVTGAMTRIEIGGRRVLVDCGVAQGAEAFEWRFDDAAADVDAVLLTHGQFDHVGSLPTLLEKGYEGPIYGTPATLELMKLVLEDGLAARGFSAAQCARLMRDLGTRVRPLRLDVNEDLGGSVAFAFREAGHILGSASVELWSSRTRLICSGNLGRPRSPLLSDYHTAWRPGRDVDLVLLESTFGDEEHAHGQRHLARELERIMLNAVERQSHVLVPDFGIGRAQTLLYHLNALVDAKRIPRIPVAIDSALGVGFRETYNTFSRLLNRDSLMRIARGDDPLDFRAFYGVRRHEHSQRLGELPGPLLIIAGDGMCTEGRVVNHLRRLLPLEHGMILFVGSAAEGTPARAIQRAAARGGRVRIDHEDVRVRAEVETLSGLSAHADRRELARWLDAIPNVRHVALHHGEPKAQRSFAAWYH